MWLDRPVGDNASRRDDVAIDDQLDRHFPGAAEARTFQIPVGLFVTTLAADRVVWRFGKASRYQRAHANLSRLRQPHLAAAGPDVTIVDAKVEEVALAVGDVGAAIANAFGPPSYDRRSSRT